MEFTSKPPSSTLGRNLFILLFFCSLLLGYGLFRYRGMLTSSLQGWLFAGVLLVMVVFFAAYAYISREVIEGFGPDEMWAQQRGDSYGLCAGFFWTIEIIAANMTPEPNRIVDIICIVGVLLVAFLGSLHGVLHTRSFAYGLRIGLWSGMLSALISCFVLLLLTYLLLGRLQLYPQYVQEFVHSGDLNITNHIVKNAILASAGHIVLGPLLGLALGALGALLGRTIVHRKPVTQQEKEGASK